MADQVQSYLALGMNQVVPKPLNIDELYGAIQRHLAAASALNDKAGHEDRVSPRSTVAG
jgi:DNA-binding response OmpR family regulator